MATLRYLTDESGRKTDVVIPMTVWHGLFPNSLNGFDELDDFDDDEWVDELSEDDDDMDETERIMANPVMYKRLMDAMERMERGEPGIPYEVVREALGI